VNSRRRPLPAVRPAARLATRLPTRPFFTAFASPMILANLCRKPRPFMVPPPIFGPSDCPTPCVLGPVALHGVRCSQPAALLPPSEMSSLGLLQAGDRLAPQPATPRGTPAHRLPARSQSGRPRGSFLTLPSRGARRTPGRGTRSSCGW